MMVLKTDREIDIMREAGRIAAEALAWAGRNAVAGRTTRELDAGVEEIIRSRGATPEFKGYHGFPASICASVNDENDHVAEDHRRVVDLHGRARAAPTRVGATTAREVVVVDGEREHVGGAGPVEEPAVQVGDRHLVDEDQRHFGIRRDPFVVEDGAREPQPAMEVDGHRRLLVGPVDAHRASLRS
jgi:hypothetical protein